MFKKISITFIAKAINALLGFANTILLTQNVGTEGKGIATIFMSNLALCLLFCHILGGSSIIYLTAKINAFKLLIACYLWEPMMAFLMAWLLYMAGICPEAYWIELGFISSLYGLFTTHLLVLLGKEKTNIYNILTPLPILFQVTTSIILFHFVHLKDIHLYLQSLYFVFGLSYVISLMVVLSSLKKFELPDRISLKKLWFYGSKAQLSNILQFFNNRIAFYILGYYFVKSEVGIYSVAVALIEVIYLIGSSISLMMYAKIANTKSTLQAIAITKPYIKISVGLTCIALICLSLIPAESYNLVFGNDFSKAKMAVLYLIPGALMMSVYLVTSCYFSGKGQYQFNNYASLLGFVIMAVGGWGFIPSGNILAAATITSVAFTAMAGFSLYLFNRQVDKATF
jgi:O-antigen/teichoic acid export membrane protein